MTVGPTDVKVIQGQTAILKCVVEHIKGIVQWAKDGVLLGKWFISVLLKVILYLLFLLGK